LQAKASNSAMPSKDDSLVLNPPVQPDKINKTNKATYCLISFPTSA
jgi:hypothetical protein